MSGNSYLQLAFYVVVLIGLAKPLGAYMARIYEGRPSLLSRIGGPVERGIYRACGIDASKETNWVGYTVALLMFNLAGGLVVYGLQRLQASLPLNPAGMTAVSPDSSFNTAISFMTNTNWQGYGGESTMSYLSQMAGLGVQNFVSAATGIAVVIALTRALARQSASTIGNFWVDMTRSVLYILLPLSFVLALVLVSQGVVQTFSAYPTASMAESVEYEKAQLDADGQPLKDAAGETVMQKVTQSEQSIAVGPAASQIAIKQLGTNGGGFFNANSAHPFENPTPLSNFLEVLAILLIPAALCYTFGVMVGDTRQGWAILAAMTLVFIVLLGVCAWAEGQGNPQLTALGVDQTTTDAQPGGNMEGKEARFGIANSVLWATATTAASNGSVNSMHDSYTPLGGLIPMWLIQLGEVIFGGVGSGLYGMLMFVVVAVFVAGLMIGRTPEYLGKKIEAYEIKMASIVVLVPLFTCLFGTAIATMVEAGRSSVANPAAHGFSEILYAFSSASGNNGSAFAGLSANTPFYNTALGIVMFFARFWIIIPVLAFAGSIVVKKRVPAGVGTLPTHGLLFVLWLVGVVIVIGALTFFPALALGPIVEHLQLYHGAQS
jgi:K+-transporting ATPase ATPase A chain